MGEPIVVGTDGSDRAKVALEEAGRLAKALGVELHVVSAYHALRGVRVAGAPEGAAKVWAPLPDSDVENNLAKAAAVLRTGGVPVTTHAVERDPADALLEVAEKVGARMIVIGSKGMHGARRLALGNVPSQVSHKATCNVLIVNTERGPAAQA